jgi:hypothetical protein
MKPRLFFGRRHREFIDGCVDPLVPLFDEHDGDIIADGILATAIRLLANQPDVMHQLEFAFFVLDAIRATQYFE